VKAVGSELRGHPSCEEEGRRCIKVLFDGTRRVTLPVLLDEADAALIVLSSFIRMSLQLPVLCACAVPGTAVTWGAQTWCTQSNRFVCVSHLCGCNKTNIGVFTVYSIALAKQSQATVGLSTLRYLDLAP